ncbi:MAG: putative multidrug resistance protein EmrK [Burkholderia lata]|uniref:Putative multidrug resistance protein EmrK n=2 Tax=Burkholderia lata (strain ATCC 17760 / DSM 23089 / LMG 22485 / NCIMB 9086 / R18194 / 383) TaxID=482957 RepID=A0A833UZ28_BURL3|nr:MAG: putative multidrug resistance protein EmrK [Burkholderia lata]
MTDTHQTSPTPASTTRRRRMTVIGGVLIVAAVAWGAWHLFSGDTTRSTDNAYVNGHVVVITPQVAGSVAAVLADNSQRIEAGQTLVEIDSSDARIALDSAQAELARTIRRVRGLFATEAQAVAMVELRQAEFNRARADLRARQGIVGQGAVTEEDARHAADTVRTAQAAVTAAEQAHAEALAQIRGTDVDDHPDVRVALERVRAAALAVERTTIRSPVSGMVAQRSVQLGKRVAVGDRLMAVVPLDRLWVDANFKEVQLDGICAGQPATVKADIYGSRMTYHGTVEEIEAGSGAAFSLLPAQNATGNWIKVVQRVPVRIRLNPDEVARHPLRIGLSAEVDVDASRCPSGKDIKRAVSAERSALYAEQQKAADRHAADAIADSAGERK